MRGFNMLGGDSPMTGNFALGQGADDVTQQMRKRGLLSALAGILPQPQMDRIEDDKTRHPEGQDSELPRIPMQVPDSPGMAGADINENGPPTMGHHLADLQSQYYQTNQPEAPVSLKQKLLRGFVGAFGGPELNQRLQQREEFGLSQRSDRRNRLLQAIEEERRMQEQEQMGTQRMTLQEKMQAAREKAAQEAQGRLFTQQNELEGTRQAARDKTLKETIAAQSATEQQREDARSRDLDKRLAAQGGKDVGTWQLKDGDDGKPVMWNSKTGQVKDAPPGIRGKPTADEQRRADLANNMEKNLDSLEEIVDRRHDLFGKFAGRMTAMQQSDSPWNPFAGTGDADVAKLKAITEYLGMASVGAHAMRNAQHVAQAAKAVTAGFMNSPEATKAAIGEARASLATFKQDVQDPGRSGRGTPNAPPLKTKVQSAAPEGHRITNGSQTLEKRHGQWVPVQ